jgi:hypothetical protein
MKVGELIVWRQQVWVDSMEESLAYSDTVGLLTRILKVDIQDEELLEIKTFKGETILAPRSECSVWSCPKNPGCFCGACH